MRSTKFSADLNLPNFDLKNAPLSIPTYSPETHYKDVASIPYFQALSILRHQVKKTSNQYFSEHVDAIDVDLFMLTPSVSSPMGPGSDSEPLPIQFGEHQTYLVDSSQFGFEPILINGINRVYCYLPSMRGEEPDDRHLNQFYHCEYEGIGNLEHVISIAEGYVKILANTLLESELLLSALSRNFEASKTFLNTLAESDHFERITFRDATQLLIDHGYESFINFTESGNSFSNDAEDKLMIILETNKPIWLTDFPRDRVPFYQKPKDCKYTYTADLLFPRISKDGFYGEILGAGQRQDSSQEMLDSLGRQGVDKTSYEWYINLRDLDNYQMTSGFGLGIERFLAWALGIKSIQDVILYPRLKNIKTLP